MVGVLSVFVQEPQFQGQTKDRLNNPEVLAAVDAPVRPALEQWLNNKQSIAEQIVARIILAARAREASRAAAAGGGRARPPRRPADPARQAHRLLEEHAATRPSCSSSKATPPAAPPSRAATARTQAILPLRGKVLNTENASLAKVLENKELADLVTALGCGIGKDFDITRLRYGKVILLADADTDGHHITTLLLTFFYRHMPQLIEHGHVYLAQPPLYRIDIGKETYWAADEPQKASHPGRQDGRRQARDHPLQGARRDDAEGAVGDDAQPQDAAGCCGSRSPTRW